MKLRWKAAASRRPCRISRTRSLPSCSSALARYNATQISGMHQALIHEQERSGAAWTLEWMILPSMVTTTVTALRSATTLLGSIMSLGEGTNASGV